jgi:hypothetical protein
VLFAHESISQLMRHVPPYGFRFPGFTAQHLDKFKQNASTRELPSYNSCAVVGNSGILLTKHHGSLIDAQDAVFRVNNAVTDPKYRTHVGNRTTLHISSSSWMKRAKLHPRRDILVVCDMPFVNSCQNILFASHRTNVRLVNPIFYKSVRDLVGNSRIPLTGFVAIAIAMRTCKNVLLFGFSTGARSACAYYYYCKSTDAAYHERTGDSLFHDFKSHKTQLRQWNESGVLRLY